MIYPVFQYGLELILPNPYYNLAIKRSRADVLAFGPNIFFASKDRRSVMADFDL